MTKAEWLEEIRVLLHDAQVETVAQPWTYAEPDLLIQIRSALRSLRAKGVLTTAVVDAAGEVTSEPTTDTEALCVAYIVAARLTQKDLVGKLRDGELGVLFKAGSDLIDTKQAARQFESVGSSYAAEAQRLLMLLIADADAGTESFFGEQSPYQA